MNENFKAETIMSMIERTIRRLWILCIILVVLLVMTNVCWIYYESQFVEEETAVTQELETGNNGGDAIINDGVHINGED